MKNKRLHLLTLISMLAATTVSSTWVVAQQKVAGGAAYPQNTIPAKSTNNNDSTPKPRWKVQRTQPITIDDLNQNGMDLKRPEGLKYEVTYNDSLNMYVIGTKIGHTYLTAPIMMTPEEYMKWSEKNARNAFYRSKNDEIYKAKGKEKFDFADMHFDLGPAEKIFGPGGIRIKTQGTAELRMGATLKNIDNPTLPIRRRKTTSIDFDEKINLNMTGKVGDKVNLGLNYNTDATFDFDAQNLKLKYEGKEDEIIKLVEGGNISFPSNSSLIQGASSLFGLRTDLQFGKLRLQLAASQKKSSSKTVSSKGGTQLTPFEIDVTKYEDNRHFFLTHFFRTHYDEWMSTLPNVRSGISINRIEIWVTNKTGSTTNTRDIIALPDLGENTVISNAMWTANGAAAPQNTANTEYETMNSTLSTARDINQTSTVLDGAGLKGGTDYEKVESARLLTSSEYTLNPAMGYISLRQGLQTDQVLAVAFEYTYGGVTYQVGEFASDVKDTEKALFVKALKNTSGAPSQPNWRLMMKNVYYLASTVERNKFRLNVKYQSDTTGVYLTYIPEQQVMNQNLLKIIGADRLDNNSKAHSNGYFDYVEGYTVSNGRVFLPQAEPFGRTLHDYLVKAGVPESQAEKYTFSELYDSTQTIAKQIAEKDKYIIQGQFSGSRANVIELGAYNVPQGSVTVTAGGVKLTEGADYTVDYAAGEVTILNQSIIDAGTNVDVSLESQTDYGMERKTMLGMNWYYDFSKDFQLSGTIQHLSEQSLTSKVSMGSEPVSNTLWGVNLNWKRESQWLTNMLDKLPGLHLTKPSMITFTGEFAQLITGQASGLQDNASYIDDFESSADKIDISTPTNWVLSSVPTMFPESADKTTLAGGYNRAQLAWYNIDPLFTNRASSLTPSHIKSDLDQLSDPYIRAVYSRELYPKRDINTYNGSTATLRILNMAYYPDERGPYNFNPNLRPDGKLPNPQAHWGGMMRKIESSDFENANIEYIEFWMMDPFIKSNRQTNAAEYGADLYFNLGEVSEDVLKDGKKAYESGLPVDGTSSFTTTQWGKIPVQATTTYSFATTGNSRELQDVGLNGLTDEEERQFASYQQFLTAIQGKVNAAVWDSIYNDPANDDYHYFRGADLDNIKADILRRYKYINNPQGNSPDTSSGSSTFDPSYKATPDVEDINQDFTLNEYERYYQYHVSLRPQDMIVGRNFIVDKRTTNPTLRNGQTQEISWYLFRIPIEQYESKVGNISDFSSIRFIRTFLTGAKHPLVLRFATLDLVRGTWRMYEQNLDNTANNTGTLTTASIGYEENSDKTPVNYVIPPGIEQEQDPTQPQLVQSDEQGMMMTFSRLGASEAKCVYKNTTTDLRDYKRLQLFVHANANDPNTTALKDNQVALFIRFGSDYKSNYYEYQVPLKLTPPDKYSENAAGRKQVWPEENMINLPLETLTTLKRERNKARGTGAASFTTPYYAYDPERPANKMTVMGNPTLGEVKVMIIGVRNLSTEEKSGEVWVNEMRVLGVNNEGGWAANAALNIQMSDLGTVNVQGKYVKAGFGGLEQSISERSKVDQSNISVTTNIELGKFFPDKAKVTAPLYYSLTKQITAPKYNPLDTDMELKDALDAAANKAERDSIERIAVTRNTTTNLSLSNVRIGIQTKRHPMPYDPANFSFSYSHSHSHSQGETTVYENQDNWRGAINYQWAPSYKAWEPFKKLKNKSKWLDIARRFGLNYLPQSVAFSTQITRDYYELQERDMAALEQGNLPVVWSSQFLWNREFQLRWDLTKNIHMNFRSATNAEIEEPYTPVNKDLYPDRYSAWKDSVWQSIKSLGTPLDYRQNFTLGYQPPLNLIPALDWVSTDAQYTASYGWVRGSESEDNLNTGNTVTMNRNINMNGNFDLVKLYNHIPFLKKANDRFEKAPDNSSRSNRGNKQQNKTNRNATQQRNKSDKDKSVSQNDAKTLLPKNRNAYEKEVVLRPDSVITLTHNKHTRRLSVTARTEDGRIFQLKYKKVGGDKLRITNSVDSVTKLKITVAPKPPLDNEKWYRIAQSAARLAMMVRNVSITYNNQYNMALPGFMPMVGDAFGQRRMGNGMAPGIDFAFGLAGDEYIDRAARNGWLFSNDSIATPATTSRTEDLQIRATLEPIRRFRIDLTATRTVTTAKSIQYMYKGNPTTQTGSFTMTTVSLGSAFESMGSATNGFHNKTFLKFVRSLEAMRSKVESRYHGVNYPAGTTLAGQTFDAANGSVSAYSGDVLIPAFLNTYTASGGGLSFFPSLAKLLPNWSLRYGGLANLSFMRDIFKSFNINHAYKSIYSVGSYQSFASFASINGSDMGFISDATTGNPIPSSMYNVPVVSINESFSPLLGIDFTLPNNLTAKVEYRQTRVLALSTTSIQLNEATSKDWVVGIGYKINNLNLFGPKIKKITGKRNGNNLNNSGNPNNSNRNSRTNTRNSSSRNSVNRDLNLRLDISLRKQAAITRDIATATSTASSGNSAFKLSFTADYTLSRLLTMSFYLDRQTNTPLLTSGTYPTTTQDFGLSIKFSLTR